MIYFKIIILVFNSQNQPDECASRAFKGRTWSIFLVDDHVDLYMGTIDIFLVLLLTITLEILMVDLNDLIKVFMITINFKAR